MQICAELGNGKVGLGGGGRGGLGCKEYILHYVEGERNGTVRYVGKEDAMGRLCRERECATVGYLRGVGGKIKRIGRTRMLAIKWCSAV